MAERRHRSQDEIMLIPFLDILCSLIGVLVLIIVVVSVAQTQRARGRTKEEVALAEKYQSLLLQLERQNETDTSTAAKLTSLDKLNADLRSKQEQLAALKKQLASSTEAAKINQEQIAKLQKQIQELIAQIAALDQSTKPVQTEIDDLKKQLAARQKKLDDKPATVVVRPYGSGTKSHQRLFFVETSGAGIAVHKSATEKQRVPYASIGVDKDYNSFLETVKKTGNSALIFLIRKDGWSAYQRAAGWAEQQYAINTGKLPIPGDGPVDLSLFQEK